VCNDKHAVRTSAYDAVWTALPGTRSATDGAGVIRPQRFGGGNMQVITTIGLDIAKSVLQVHGS